MRPYLKKMGDEEEEGKERKKTKQKYAFKENFLVNTFCLCIICIQMIKIRCIMERDVCNRKMII